MKNLILKAKILLIALIFIFSGNANAQFGEDDRLLSLGISVGNPGYYNYPFKGKTYYSSFFPPIIFQGEFGAIYKYISIGGQVGYQSKTYKDRSNPGYYHKYTYYSVGVIGAYHYSNLIQDLSESSKKYLEKFDLYASLIFRFDIEYYKTTLVNYDSYNDVHPKLGLLLGARFYLTDNIALWSELGYGNLGVFTFGFTYKLGK